ncbi:conserved hypothetical protein [Neospora caninum Liverpool]|uniref:Uncharacterized protein n=1 Tax=Neospora caninum (strain Liverpool) TaxID=572307 RepID=F0VD71_NEOCL|nr:conserved hypothetical protein [Neospora caninum Liverpool]CBZ51586.1 conserved hypothetical protein [Neospora caninum Liverpool]|eukprot:XP_003881619.1 conserved hypothetical protein [Neospora caninum Liverpool]
MEDYRQRHREAYERRVAEQKAREERERLAAAQQNGTGDGAAQPSASSPEKAPQSGPAASVSDLSSARAPAGVAAASSSALSCAGASPASLSAASSARAGDRDAAALAAEAASLEEARRLQREFEAEMEGIRPPDDTYQETLISEEVPPATLAWWDTAGALPVGVAHGSRSPSRSGQPAEPRDRVASAVTPPQAEGEEDDAALARRLQEEEYNRHRGVSPVQVGRSVAESPSRPLYAQTPPRYVATRAHESPSAPHVSPAFRTCAGSPERCVIDVDRDSNSDVQVSSRPTSPSPASPSHGRPGSTPSGAASPWAVQGTWPATREGRTVPGRGSPGSAVTPYPARSQEAEVFAAAGIDLDSDEAILQAAIAQSLVDM